MKKNKAMRLAAVLLVVTLLSTCVVSGTFAKYVTKASAEDSSTVAKFGITVSATGDDCFAEEYAKDDTGYTGTNTVISSSTGSNRVAPGTANSSAASFSIKGKAEVAVNVAITFTGSDVFLKGGTGVTYLDYTTGDDTTDTFAQTAYYYPVVVTLVHTYTTATCWPIAPTDPSGVSAGYSRTTAVSTSDASKTVETITGTMADLQKVFAALSMGSIAPNYTFDDQFDLSWAWAFTGNDAADTLLGNLAADSTTFGTGLTAGTDYSLTEDFDFSITVTQVD